MRKVNDYLIEPGFLPIPFCYSSLSSFHGARAEHGLEFCFLLPSQEIYITYHDSMVLALCMEPGYIVPSISTVEMSHPQYRKHIMHPFTLSHKVMQLNYLKGKPPPKRELKLQTPSQSSSPGTSPVPPGSSSNQPPQPKYQH